MSKCIYCLKEKDFSDSHIIPEGLGKGPSLNKGVCKKCNNDINKNIERKIIDKLAPIRFLLQLEGKRGKKVKAKLRHSFGGKEFTITISDIEDVRKRVLIYENVKDSKGNDISVAIFGEGDALVQKAKEMKFEDYKPSPIEIKMGLHFDVSVFASKEALRTAAKIALEMWCENHSIEVAATKEFNEVREYIVNGIEPDNYRISSICIDSRLLSLMGDIPFGIHSVGICEDPRSYYLVCYVGLFSLVYYKIILSTRHTSYLASRSDVLIAVNPQTGNVEEPCILRPGIRPPRLATVDSVDSMDALGVLEQHIINKLNNGLRSLGVIKDS